MFKLIESLIARLKCKRRGFNDLVLYYATSLLMSCSVILCLSEIDDEDCERRRMECLDEMSDLEKQFLELKEK